MEKGRRNTVITEYNTQIFHVLRHIRTSTNITHTPEKTSKYIYNVGNVFSTFGKMFSENNIYTHNNKKKCIHTTLWLESYI